VERMGPKAAELIVGARNDPEWGPVLLAGFGGVLAEAIRDVRILPPISPLRKLSGNSTLFNALCSSMDFVVRLRSILRQRRKCSSISAN